MVGEQRFDRCAEQHFAQIEAGDECHRETSFGSERFGCRRVPVPALDSSMARGGVSPTGRESWTRRGPVIERKECCWRRSQVVQARKQCDSGTCRPEQIDPTRSGLPSTAAPGTGACSRESLDRLGPLAGDQLSMRTASLAHARVDGGDAEDTCKRTTNLLRQNARIRNELISWAFCTIFSPGPQGLQQSLPLQKTFLSVSRGA
jgi:hypothetical protein